MAHMHRSGRIGRDEFDIDAGAAPLGGAAIIVAQRGDGRQFAQPDIRLEADVDETGPRDIGRNNVRIAGQMRHDLVRQRARIALCLLGQHHRGIGGQIAMRRIARRLDRDIAAIAIGRQIAFHLERVEHRIDLGGVMGVESLRVGHVSARLRARGERVRIEPWGAMALPKRRRHPV